MISAGAGAERRTRRGRGSALAIEQYGDVVYRNHNQIIPLISIDISDDHGKRYGAEIIRRSGRELAASLIQQARV